MLTPADLETIRAIAREEAQAALASFRIDAAALARELVNELEAQRTAKRAAKARPPEPKIEITEADRAAARAYARRLGLIVREPKPKR